MAAADREALVAYLQEVGRQDDDRIDLAKAALALAALDRPQVSLDRYRDHLAELAEAGSVADDAAIGDCIAALTGTMTGRFGYSGDELTYDDVQNANLMRVIDRRRGLPVALGILYLHAGRARGWAMHGLNFPGHFLIRLDRAGQRAVLDPFHGGRQLTSADLRALLGAVAPGNDLQPDHHTAVGNRAILLRLQNNIRSRAEAAGKKERVAAVLHSMLLVAPDRAEYWRDYGRAQAELGQIKDGIAATRRYMELAGADAASRHEALAFLQQLGQKLN